MNNTISTALKHWVPYRLDQTNDSEACRWLYLGDERITEPFFSDTISNRRGLASNTQRFRSVSGLSVLKEWADQTDYVPPTAIIFHISRCGSTLLSQLLNMQQSNVVLSEVPFFDELLRFGFINKNIPAMLPLVKAAINLYGAKRNADDARLFIKSDSWHIHFYKELRSLFPDTPFLLLYRRPDEVIRSQQKKRGMQAVQGVIEPGIFGFDVEAIMQLNFDEYMAKVIESYLNAFVNILEHDPLAIPVNYKEGGVPIIEKLAAACNFPITGDELNAMKERAGFDAKYPDKVFAEAPLQQDIPAYLTSAFAWYDSIEKIRLSR